MWHKIKCYNRHMNTKIVYILVSDKDDSYLEQTLTSVCSLRVHSPDAKVILVTDRVTDNTLSGEREKILNFITEKKVIEIPDGYSKMQRSRYLKTSLREIITGDFLFVDSDTVIMRDLADVDNLRMDIGAVLDCHLPFSKHPYKKKISKKLLKSGVSLKEMGNRYYNSGVMYVRDTPQTHLFYEKWHETWQTCVGLGINTDQQALTKADYLCGNPIQELCGIWNCQPRYCYKKQILENAYILHYFSSSVSNIPLLVNSLYKLNSTELNELIVCARHTRFPIFNFLVDDITELSRTMVGKVFLFHKRMFGLLERICSIFLKIT